MQQPHTFFLTKNAPFSIQLVRQIIKRISGIFCVAILDKNAADDIVKAIKEKSRSNKDYSWLGV